MLIASVAVYNGAAFTAIDTALRIQAAMLVAGIGTLIQRYPVWPEYTISADNPKAFGLKNIPTQTFLLRYLLEGKKAGPWLSFKTFREMPWGELYISPYTGRVLTRAAFTFGTRVGKFAEACEKMGGARVEHGDAGYEFELLPGYRMQIMVYAGDDEFPPSSQVLYSDNFETGFSAEDRVVAGDILISSIKNNF